MGLVLQILVRMEGHAPRQQQKRMAAGYTCSCLAGFTGTECELKGK
jgi:hypothetical protein